MTGKLWESEHGPTGGDEINIIEPGHNYGWGVITMGVEPGITKRSEPGMEQPIVYYTPTIAPSGIVFYTGDKYPGWKNNLFVSALAGQQLRRLEISGDKVVAPGAVFNQFGRVHDVIVGPDGLLYVTLQLPGQVLSSVHAGHGRAPGAGDEVKGTMKRFHTDRSRSPASLVCRRARRRSTAARSRCRSTSSTPKGGRPPCSCRPPGRRR